MTRQLGALRRFVAWLRSVPGACPDIERAELRNYARRAPIEDRGALHDIFESFDNPHSGCPDAEIGGMIDACVEQAAGILCKNLPLLPMEEAIVGRVYFGGETVKSLPWAANLPIQDPFEGHEAEPLEALQELVRAGYVGDNGELYLTPKFFEDAAV